MELDWCLQENFSNYELFNDKSLIGYNDTKKNQQKYKNISHLKNDNKNIVATNCFKLNLETNDKNEILEILNYLSFVSNNLRAIIRNKNLLSDFDKLTFNDLIKYLQWLSDACNKIKVHFNCGRKKENTNDSLFKPFKTSSYKFCNFKNSCSIHKNKYCDKNHFVFDMVYNDINKLIESLNIITTENLDNINWIFLDNSIKICVSENSTYLIEKTNNDEYNQVEQNNIYFINKNSVFKCFDVISYVLNKMFEEASYFFTYDVDSSLIKIQFEK